MMFKFTMYFVPIYRYLRLLIAHWNIGRDINLEKFLTEKDVSLRHILFNTSTSILDTCLAWKELKELNEICNLSFAATCKIKG